MTPSVDRKVGELVPRAAIPLAYAIACTAGCVSTQPIGTELLFSGLCYVGTAEGTDAARYRLVRNEIDGTLSLTVDKPAEHELWVATIGQTFPTAIYHRTVPALGNVLVVEADHGASMQRLIVVRVDPMNQMTVFDEVSRFGFDIVDLSGDATVEIVEKSGDLFGPKQIVIYAWNGSRYAPIQEERSSQLPHYQLVFGQ